uniref:Uncharacterized protein n=1 Tax=Trichobilharzia regenti TaxID=157069 RepID=A0AA85ILX9_TRIRE|nr:unnamed protein product [Trichobilharzia regenti]
MANTSPTQNDEAIKEQAKPITPMGYTKDEMREFTQLLVKYKNMLTDRERSQPSLMMKKHMWMQFSEYLHSKGYPRRHWTRLRHKGQKMLREMDLTMKDRQTTVCPDTPKSSESTSVHQVVVSVNGDSHVSGQCTPVGNVESSVGQLSLPSLTPSPCVWISPGPHINSTPPMVSTHTSPSNTMGLRILNVYSIAPIPQDLCVPYDSAEKTVKSGNKSDELTNGVLGHSGVNESVSVSNGGEVKGCRVGDVGVCEPRCVGGGGSGESETIDLSVSSDEESVEEMDVNGVGDGGVGTGDASDRGYRSDDDVDDGERRRRSALMFEKQMRYLDLKIEVLEMQKRYWCEKMNSMTPS